MNDAEYRKQQARVRKFAGKWHHALGLGWWRVSYVYEREADMREAGQPGEFIAPTVLAVCKADWRYKHATVTFNLARVAEIPDEELERAVVHEQLHILVHELREVDRETHLPHEERVVSELTTAMFWVAEAGAKNKWGKPMPKGA